MPEEPPDIKALRYRAWIDITMMPSLPALLVLSIFFSSGLCAIYQQLSDLTQDEYDFVIVGGGTAGTVLASRLTEISHFQVLVIEAGPSGEGSLDVPIPFFAPNLQGSAYDWNFTTVPMPNADNRSVVFPRGRILGGSSSINVMVYTRGTVDDYNRWASFAGDSSWSWDKVFPYFIKHEQFVQPTSGMNVTGDFDPNIHGYDGPIRVSLPNEPQKIFDVKFFEAADELGGVFEYNVDMNSGNPCGSTWMQATQGGGERSSAATGYLSPSVAARQNLHIVLNTMVTKVQKSTSSEDNGPEFDTVEAVGNSNSTRTFKATKEMIISTGTIHTPHLLFHSGFGDADTLKSLGITPLVDMPSLGKNLSDHPRLQIDFAASNTEPNVLSNSTFLEEAMEQWKSSRTGPLSNSPINNLIWGRVPADMLPEDPSAGHRSPHWEIIPAVNLGPAPNEHVFVFMGVVSPASRGSISIGSNNPFDPPLIDPGFFSNPVDLIPARDVIRNTRKFFSAKTWEGYIVSEAAASASIQSDDELDAFIRSTVESLVHPVGSAGMSPKGAKYGVVDPDMKVKGVKGMRIVDASVIPVVPAGHSQAAVYVVAERAADLIKKDWARRR